MWRSPDGSRGACDGTPAGTYDPRSATDLLYGLRHEGVANLPVPMSVLLMIVMTAVFSALLVIQLALA